MTIDFVEKCEYVNPLKVKVTFKSTEASTTNPGIYKLTVKSIPTPNMYLADPYKTYAGGYAVPTLVKPTKDTTTVSHRT